MPVPPCPPVFAVDRAPDGVEVRFVEFLAQRPVMAEQPRAIVVHTNGAGGEGSIESAWNWTHAKPNSNTLPHYQVDRSGRARKFIPSNVRGIANNTVTPSHGDWGKLSAAERAAVLEHPVRAAEWALAIETADTGYLNDPTISDFTPAQAETVATIIAYESIVCGFPIDIPDKWWGAGVCSHTDPFPYPFLTSARGKICPGGKKKASVRNVIIPRAREIAAAWTAPRPVPVPVPSPAPPAPTPQPSREDDMLFIGTTGGGVFWFGYLTEGAHWATPATAKRLLATNKVYDAKTGALLWGAKSHTSVGEVTEAELTDLFGPDRFQHGRKI